MVINNKEFSKTRSEENNFTPYLPRELGQKALKSKPTFQVIYKIQKTLRIIYLIIFHNWCIRAERYSHQT